MSFILKKLQYQMIFNNCLKIFQTNYFKNNSSLKMKRKNILKFKIKKEKKLCQNKASQCCLNDDIDQIYQVADETNNQNETNQSFNIQNQEINILQKSNCDKISSNFKKQYEQKLIQIQKQCSQFSITSQQSPWQNVRLQLQNKKNSKNTVNQNMLSFTLNEDQNTLNSLANNNNNNKCDLTLNQYLFFPKCLQNASYLEKQFTHISENKDFN
ncbi:hypothetical protein ABPG72_000579 [Tetrahymena utriculariae]